MRFDIITLFPQLFEPFQTQGITRRAYTSGQIDLHLWPLRDFAQGAHRNVDDRPFGGGPGMVMLAEPLLQALTHVRAQRPRDAAPVIIFSPAGQVMTHQRIAEMAADPVGAIFICGRYEGMDQRFIDAHVDQAWSLGDFVLSGGEIPALAVLDAVARLLPGVLGDAQSAVQESFVDGLLDCPHYTRPEVLAGQAVPAVLTSGNHADIAKWRREQSLTLTLKHRPDLLERARAAGQLSAADERYLKAQPL